MTLLPPDRRPLTIGSLFSGIGALELGLERAGVGHTVWQVEKDAYCRAVLAKHWPDATRYEDVKDVGQHNLESVDVICGGFPCQDISYAGPGGGLDGDRSGLWWQFVRIVREMGPDYVVVENVTALLDRGMGDVLGTLAGLGYDAEWSRVTACSVGAPHMRPRVFIVAYANGVNGRPRVRNPDAQSFRKVSSVDRFARARASWRTRLANPSALYGGADGLRDGSHRNRAIGNAVVPDVGEVVGRVILALEASSRAVQETA